ncbi:MAG: hypothetical protein ACP5KS_09900, partial [Candidatus Hydrogenedens sp.]
VLEKMGRYFLRYGWYSEVGEIYGGLAKKYPGSKIARNANSWAKQIERSPIDASLEVIAMEIEGSRRSGEREKVTGYYRDISERTPNSDLRARLVTQQIHPMEQLKYNRRMNDLEESLFSNYDPALEPLQKSFLQNINPQ